TVPLDFEQPVRVIEWRGRQRGGHGFDELGQLRAGGLRQVDLGLCGRGAALPQRRPLALDLVVGPPGLDGLWEVLGVPAADRGFVALVDEEPGLAVLSFPRPGANDREAALQLLPVEPELQLAFLDRLRRVRRFGVRLPGAPVPHDHVAGAVFAPGNRGLEVHVLEGVILDLHREAPLLRVGGRPLRDCPADEHAVDLEPKVVVEPGGAVALDDKSAAAGLPGRLRLCRRSRWFRCLPEVALALVGLEGHGLSLGNPRGGGKPSTEHGADQAGGGSIQAVLRRRAGFSSRSSLALFALADAGLRAGSLPSRSSPSAASPAAFARASDLARASRTETGFSPDRDALAAFTLASRAAIRSTRLLAGSGAGAATSRPSTLASMTFMSASRYSSL